MRKILFIVFVFLAAVLVFAAIVFLFTLNKSKGALQITSSPDAKVYLDGKLIGNTPLCKCDLKNMLVEGEYTIKLVPTSGGFDSFEQKIKISPRVLTVVDRNFAESGLDSTSIINLFALSDKKDAQISAMTFPEGAQVFLDDSLQGQTPILLKNVKVSDHELRFTKEGYKDKIVRVRTVLGYKLESVIYLGLNPNIATLSAGTTTASMGALLGGVEKIEILDTPTGFLRVRENSSISSAEIGQVSPGDTFDLLDEQNSWYKIKLTSGKEGWISSEYAKKTN